MFKFIARVANVVSTRLWGGEFLKSLRQEFDFYSPNDFKDAGAGGYYIEWISPKTGDKLIGIFCSVFKTGEYTLKSNRGDSVRINSTYGGFLDFYSNEALKSYNNQESNSKIDKLSALGYSGYISKKGEVE